ncbi:MAG TPA: hypothetical protein VKK79_08435 [Candidatus Lokiarchaeia archaeon]|nr:hypothetical protein [Candidatus Lokiarchaeia archaeon]
MVATRLDIHLKLDRLTLAIGLILPDLVDKLLMWTIGTSGRDWAHNLLFIGLAGIPFVIARKMPMARSIWLGCFIHLLLDMPGVPWLFPFVPTAISYNIDYTAGFMNYFIAGLIQPIAWTTELVGIACMVILIYANHLTSFAAIKDFLKNPALNIQPEKEKN